MLEWASTAAEYVETYHYLRITVESKRTYLWYWIALDFWHEHKYSSSKANLVRMTNRHDSPNQQPNGTEPIDQKWNLFIEK